jgi:SAM-dependent methyltransferase
MSVRPPRRLLDALDRMPVGDDTDQLDALEEIRYLLADLAAAEDGPVGKVGIREWIATDLRAILDANGLTGCVAEIGGAGNGLRTLLPEWEFTFLSLYPGDDPDMVVADITACPQIPDESYDAVVSVNCFEHVERPWRAADEITRILRPGGVAYHVAPFSYFYHRAPIDYWRYTPDAMAAMFGDLEPLKAEFYGANRRRNNRGSTANPVDGDGGAAFAEDGFGGWRENWYAVYAGRKSDGWRERRIERDRQQLVVDICKALTHYGVSEETLATEAARALRAVTVSAAGEVARAGAGEGIELEPAAVDAIWRGRGRLGIRPSFRRFAHLALSGHPAVR